MKVALEFVSNRTKFHKEFSHIDILCTVYFESNYYSDSCLKCQISLNSRTICRLAA